MAALKAQFTESDLKKQTQFAGGVNSAKSVMTMVYGNIGIWRRQQNKANSKPIKPNFKIMDKIFEEFRSFNAIIKSSRPKITLFPLAAVLRRANE